MTRRIFAFNRMEPSFIIIGEARCGTTSLFNYICENNRVLPPSKKEIHFFDYKFHNGKSWYKAYFPIKNKNKITGEATPYYFSHPKAAKRLKETFPKMKIILILRNPIDRAISSYYKQRKLSLEHIESVEKAVDLEDVRLKESMYNMLNKNDYDYNHKNYAYVKRGLYYENLKRWMTLFDDDQMLIFEFDDLFGNLEANYKRVVDFLDIDDRKMYFEHFNKGSYKNINPKFRAKLASLFEDNNKKLYKLLKVDYNWK